MKTNRIVISVPPVKRRGFQPPPSKVFRSGRGSYARAQFKRIED